MTAFTHHLSYDFKTGIRDRSKLLMFYLFPLVFFFVVGAFMVQINPGFRQTMLPGMMIFAYMSSVLLSLPSALVEARESGVFRSYRINGVPSASILATPVIGAFVHMIVVSVVISFAGARLFGGAVPASVPGFIAAALMAFLTYAAIGLLIGVAAGNSNVSILVSQLLYIPSILLGGIMVPTSLMPNAFRRIGLLLPAAHSMRVFNGLAFGGPFPSASFAVLCASIIMNLLLAELLFEWDSRATQPCPKAWAALIAALPFVASALATN
jgi:ABC-2 type transport system permease protein